MANTEQFPPKKSLFEFWEDMELQRLVWALRIGSKVGVNVGFRLESGLGLGGSIGMIRIG